MKPYSVHWKRQGEWIKVFETHDPTAARDYARNRIVHGGITERIEIRVACWPLETVYASAWTPGGNPAAGPTEGITTMFEDTNKPTETATQEPQKQSRKSAKTGVEHIQRLLDETGHTASELSAALHQSHSVVARWLAAGQAPAWTLVAVEGLRRRARIKTPDLYITTVPPGHVETVRTLTRLGFTFQKIERDST